MNLPAHKKMLSTAAAVSVLLITAACGSSESSDSAAASDTSTSAAPSADATTEAPAESSDSAGTYVDGDYSGEGSYSNPGGSSTVKVDLTLEGGKVTDVTVTPEAENGTSKQYQSQFASGVSSEVVGKSLDEIKVSKVAGSSLTSEGFNQAIDQIKGEAQA